MKEIFGLKIGGLKQKLYNLCLILMLLVVITYVASGAYQLTTLRKTVEEANENMQTTIGDISDRTMEEVINASLTQNTALEAGTADELFADVSRDVLSLRSYAEELFDRQDELELQKTDYPQLELDGVASAQMQHDVGVDPKKSEYFRIVSNMQDMMINMYRSSDKLSSCIVATADGTILYVDDRSGEYFDANGNVIKHFNARSRPWYKGAVEKGDVFFTSVERDSFTDYIGVVCSAPVYYQGKLVAVVAADLFLDSMTEQVKNLSGKSNFVSIVDNNGKVVFSPKTSGNFVVQAADRSKDLRTSEDCSLSDFITNALKANTEVSLITDEEVEYYAAGSPLPTVGWTFISLVDKEVTRQPTAEMLGQYNTIIEKANEDVNTLSKKALNTMLLLTVVLLSIGGIAAILFAGRIVHPLEAMTKRIGELRGDDLIFRMDHDYKTGDEIEELALAFSDLSEKTVRYVNDITHITAEKERIGAELDFATGIQANVLPRIFPAFPDRTDFDIYATMNPAKEVGGDFYDFFLIDKDHLTLVIADVSGKGVPAALFMMIAKTLIKSRAQMGGRPSEILFDVNNQLCEDNEAQLFVTVWLGILDLRTGEGLASNAGHEHPAVRRRDGKFELIKNKHSPAIGVIKDMKFREHSFTMNPGDTLFVYTDGVAEATNSDNELFGTNRMIDALNTDPDTPLDTMLKKLRSEIDSFVGTAPQFDDITMLGMKYFGNERESSEDNK